ncbi:4-hydroxy-3-methylbut-2-enyl diphosphate reductase [Candidatus Woesearchaeota archaeon]|nr:4-hydroxy-3-methylbut-2-enyl diphosphate reductase [Candidatus Woesearchaeota archaeon]
MEIRIAKPIGFCKGARDVVEIAEDLDKAYSLGPILHNEQLIEKLRKKGIEPLSLDEILKRDPGKVIIRAHGVTADDLQKLEDGGFKVIDKTCRKVQDVYCISADYEKEGYKIFIFGDPKHPEVIGIVSRLSDPTIIRNIEEIPDQQYEKVCLVSQTTQIASRYKEIEKIFLMRCNELKVVDTICPATKDRQDAASSLAKEVDVMIIIGGKKSSNTRKLYTLCQNANINSYLIQTKDDLKEISFNDVKSVGITAGASTPDFIIKSVKNELERY